MMGIRVRVALVCAVVAASVLASPALALAKSKPPRYPNAILYVSSNHQLWRMNPDGSNRKKLANSASADTAWSPDHSKVAYVHIGKKGATTIWTVWANGKGAKQLTYKRPWKGWKYGKASGVTWSSNSRYLAYVDANPLHKQSRDRAIIVDLKKHKSRALAAALKDAGATGATAYGSIDGLKYTPGGKELLVRESFLGDHTKYGLGSSLRTIRVSNGKTHLWIDAGVDDHWIYSADVGPDGSVVFSTEKIYWRGSDCHIMVGSTSILTTDASQLVPGGCAWAPTGKRIAYSLQDATSQATSMTVVARDGTGAQPLGLGEVTSWR